jgi:serine/threonine-protein kinase
VVSGPVDELLPDGEDEPAGPRLEPVEFTPDQESATLPYRPGSSELARKGALADAQTRDLMAVTPPSSQAPTIERPASAAPPAKLEALGIQGYKVWEELGRGAQGTVYRATPMGGGEDVAVKVLRAEAGEAEAQRFERAVEAMAVLAAVGGVVHSIARGRTALGSPFFTMELVRGPSLRSVLDEGALDPVQLCLVLADVAYAVHDAHDRGIVHRDLKPENILLERGADGSFAARIADFGLARDIYQGPETTSSGGTPAYMAPEQVMGGAISRRTDVHALGVILYEIIAGVPPFRRETIAAVARALVEERPRPPVTLWSGLPDALSLVALRALEKDPERRYPTAAAFASEIERALRGETIGGVPVRPLRGPGGRLGRLRGAAGAAIARRKGFIAGLAFGLAFGTASGLTLGKLGYLGGGAGSPASRPR